MSPDSERDRALASFETGDYPQAARRLISLLANGSPDPLLLRLCGMALVRVGQPAQGVPYLARARRLAPRDPLPALWHGIALHAGGHFAEAAAALQASSAAASDDPAPWIHLSRALIKMGRSTEAVAAATNAVHLAPALLDAHHALRLAELIDRQAAQPSDPEALARAWLGLGLACLRLDRVPEARSALQQALVQQPGNDEAECWLAMVEHLGGEPVTAIDRLRAVLDRKPQASLARLHLASRLILDGDATEGLALLEPICPDAIELQARWQAWRIAALMALGRAAEAEDALAQVTAMASAAGVEIILRWQQAVLARRVGNTEMASALLDRVAQLAIDRGQSELEDRLDAHFRLAGLHEAEGRHRQAFFHWRQGHALHRAAQPFSRTAHAALHKTIIGAFSRDRLVNGPRAAVTDRSAVFIVGLPRTGTSLVEQVLSAHPMVHGAGERLAIRNALMALVGTTGARDAAIRAAALDAPALTRAADNFMDMLHAEAPDAHIVLDKMPDNINQLGFIAMLLPGARVICCTRDLRDVGISIFRQRFLGHHPYAHDLADLGWYMAQHRLLLTHWRDVLPIPMLELDHADWIADFDATLRRVLDFLGLPWNPACQRFFEQTRMMRTASRDQVRRPINADGIGRWQSYADELAPMFREIRF